ncbi:MAG: bifunctional 5,10-methylenetetrahydrofolate dehydrogenase/5,10-methenyltetrahydrofolate cyclohydrolase [Anaerovorax sp.]
MILKGKPVADQIKEDMIEKVQQYKSLGIVPKLAILRVGNRPDDLAYEARVLKNCESMGILGETVVVDENINMVNLKNRLEGLNLDKDVHGILVFRPLPKHLSEEELCESIDPQKDIDCMSPVNTGKVFLGDPTGFSPCTPEAVIEILKFYGYSLMGKNVAIVNRSMVLGKPLSMLFLNENSTVTVCHSKTKNLERLTSNCDIVVTGVGKGKFFTPNYFSSKTTVIDVGINFEDGSLCGDVDYDNTEGRVMAITPVPGGVGTVTSMILLRHILRGIELQKNQI